MGEAERLKNQVDQLQKGMADLRNERDKLKRQVMEMRREREVVAATAEPTSNGLTYRIGPRGGIILDGLRSPMHPVTLYKREIQRVLAAKEDIDRFITTNDAFLSQGPDDPRFPKLPSSPRRRKARGARRS